MCPTYNVDKVREPFGDEETSIGDNGQFQGTGHRVIPGSPRHQQYPCVLAAPNTTDRLQPMDISMWLAFSYPQSLDPSPLISHKQRLTYKLRRKLAIRESQVIKWAWENLDAEGIYFGPEIEMEEESEICTEEEDHLVGSPPATPASSKDHLVGRVKGSPPVTPASSKDHLVGRVKGRPPVTPASSKDHLVGRVKGRPPVTPASSKDHLVERVKGRPPVTLASSNHQKGHEAVCQLRRAMKVITFW